METKHILALLSKFCDTTGIGPLPPLRTAFSHPTRVSGLMGRPSWQQVRPQKTYFLSYGAKHDQETTI